MTLLHRLESGGPPLDEALLTQQTAEPQLSAMDRPAKRSRLDLSSQAKDAPRQRDWREGGHVIEHNDVHIDSRVLGLVAEGLWQNVGEMLRHGVSDSLRRWVIGVACQQAGDFEFTLHILPHCAADQRDSVLEKLVTRGLWISVDTLFGCGVSPAQRRWALRQACQQADDENFVWFIFPHCTDDQLDDVLTTLVARRLWKSVNRLLHRGVSPTLRSWAAHEACQHAEDEVVFECIPHCADDQLDGVLTTLVTRRLWKSVNRLLHRSVSPTLRSWAVHEACQHAEDEVVFECILPHCADDQLDGVLTTLVTRRLWKSVNRVLDLGVTVSPVKRSWAVREACQHSNDKDAIQCVVDQHSSDQQDDIVTTLASQCMWKHVARVLDLNVSPAQMIHDGMSVLHSLIRRGSWGLVKLLMGYVVEFNHHTFSTEERIGDRRSPLEILIDARQMDIIMYIFSRCLDLSRGVNSAGETILHVACLTGCPSVLQELLGKRADPRAVTFTGHSPLSYAVMCRDRPQQTVAECIRLGFSTHQSRLANSEQNVTDGEPHHNDTEGINSEDAHSVENDTNSMNASSSDHDDMDRTNSEVTNSRESDDADGIDSDDSHNTASNAHDIMMSSPTLLAVMRGLPLVT